MLLYARMDKEIRLSDDTTKFIFNGKEVTEDEWRALEEGYQQAMLNEENTVKDQYQVNDETAASIVYLRSRSRWSPEKEAELVDRYREGRPIPLADVLSGEF